LPWTAAFSSVRLVKPRLRRGIDAVDLRAGLDRLALAGLEGVDDLFQPFGVRSS
jgi:hypothetical protein